VNDERLNLAKAEPGAISSASGHPALQLAELVFRLEPFKTHAPTWLTKNSALARATKDSTLNGQCGPAAQLLAAEACRLDARLTAAAKTTTFKSDRAILLLDLTVNGLHGPHAQSAAAVVLFPALATTLALEKLNSSLPLATSSPARTTVSGPTGELALYHAVSDLNLELDIASEALLEADSAVAMTSPLSTPLPVITAIAATSFGQTGLAAATKTAETSDFDSAVVALALTTSKKKSHAEQLEFLLKHAR